MLTRKEMAEQRVREITEIASRLLCEMGYERASVRDLAQATGMTKAGLYYYFQNKEELLFVILNGYMDSLLAGVATIEEQEPDPARRLRRFIGFQVDVYCRDTYRSKLIIHDENCLSGEWLRTVKDKQRHYLVYWKRALNAYCRERGIDLPYPSSHAMILLGMCNWIYQWYSPQGEMPPEVLADLIYQRFLHGLAAPLPPPPRESA